MKQQLHGACMSVMLLQLLAIALLATNLLHTQLPCIQSHSFARPCEEAYYPSTHTLSPILTPVLHKTSIRCSRHCGPSWASTVYIYVLLQWRDHFLGQISRHMHVVNYKHNLLMLSIVLSKYPDHSNCRSASVSTCQEAIVPENLSVMHHFLWASCVQAYNLIPQQA